MDAKERILDHVRREGMEKAFTAKDLAAVAPRGTIDVVLSRLTKEGATRRIGRGLYDCPRRSEMLGEAVAPDIDQAAQAIARKHRWTIAPAHRTFWEKATILHAEYHRSLDKPLLPRYSRHYADVAAMAQTTTKDEAMADLGLLESVCHHKDRFYHCGWARYLEAKPGTFHVVPREERLAALRRDYQDMRVMYFSEAPTFDVVLGQLASLEHEINNA